ncbi:MAG: protein kinase [Verrucomicrobiales bacterium]|nr:protein kinase [Verrucomicrobiales bacterium]
MIRSDDVSCTRCLLDVASGQDDMALEDQLFQQALALKREDRLSFIHEATRGNAALSAALQLLLEGHEEAEQEEEQEQIMAASAEEPGTVIDQFRLVRLLGEGGMGAVWLAQQTAPVTRSVALKIIKLGMDTREVIQRFQRERQTLALLQHPNIAQVFQAGATATGRPYFAMELVEGAPIVDYCETESLDLGARLRLFQEVCAAVEHAHQKGVIHRDLKPSNILVADGKVKVIDFGLARATQEVGEGSLFTRQLQILGTPPYMSPEQARSAGVDIDTRTDVYSLGVVLYEMLTGVLPIEASRLTNTSVAEMQRILCEEEPQIPSRRITTFVAEASPTLEIKERQAYLQGDLDWVVMKAIRKDREARYARAAALAEDLRRFLAGEPVEAVPPTLGYRTAKFVRRNRLAVAAGASVFLALLSGLVVSMTQVRRTERALAGEASARREATFTLSDMYTRSGLTAAETGDSERAALWFASAALIAADDPDRSSANRRRTEAWRQECRTAVRALDTGYDHLRSIVWNPRQDAMIVEAENAASAQVWDLETEQSWLPLRESKIHRAAWGPEGDKLAALLPGNVMAVFAYPSGSELARLEGAVADQIAWSPDGRWVASATAVWDWRTGEVRQFSKACQRVRFDQSGNRLLLQSGSKTGICLVSDPSKFLHPPSPSHPWGGSEFLNDGDAYVVGENNGDLVVRRSTSGEVLGRHPVPARAMEGSGTPLDVSLDGRFVARRDAPVRDLQRSIDLTFPRHQSLHMGARFSPDGTLLASGGYDLKLQLWSVADGLFLGSIGRHHTAVVNVEFSPDGRFVAAAEDGLVRIWRILRPQLVRTIAAGENGLAAISGDGTYVASSGFTTESGKVRRTQAFDISTGRPAGPAIDPSGTIMDVVFGNGGDWMAIAVSTTSDRSLSAFEKSGGSGNIQFWNFLTGQRLGEPIPMPSEPRGLCLHPAGRWIGVCCAGSEGVEIEWSNRVSRVLFGPDIISHANATLNNGRCAYSPDGRVFASWGLVDTTVMYSRDENRVIFTNAHPAFTTFDMAFHGNNSAWALVTSKMRIEFRDVQTGRSIAPAIPYSNWPFLTRFSPDGKLLLTAGGGRTAQIWDWRSGQLVCPMLSHEETIMAGCFVPGTPWVITGGHDGKIKFWDRRTGMMIRPPLQRNGWVLDLRLTPDARTLIASGILDGNIELSDLDSALPSAMLDPAAERLLAEIDADAEVHPGGDLAQLSPESWLKKWREFRTRYPDYSGHRLH